MSINRNNFINLGNNMKLLKFLGYWWLYSFCSLVAVGLSNLVTKSDTLTGLLSLLAMGYSVYLAYKKVYKGDYASTTKNEDLGEGLKFEVKVSTGVSYSGREKQLTDKELEETAKYLSDNANKTLPKQLEITLKGQEIDFPKKVISGSYKETLKGMDSDISEKSSEDVLLYSLLKSKTQLCEYSNLASSLSKSYFEGLQELRNTEDFRNSGEHDQESLFDEYRERFSEKVLEKCFKDEYCDYHFMESYIENIDSWDYSIFEEFGYNNTKAILETCSYQAEREGVFSCASDSYNFKYVKKLSELGVFKNGSEIPAKLLLVKLRAKDIRELAKEKGITIKGRKKEDLINSYLEQSEITTKDIGKFLAVRELFILDEEFSKKHNLSSNRHTWNKHKMDCNYIENRIDNVATAKYLGDKPESAFNKNFITKVEAKKVA